MSSSSSLLQLDFSAIPVRGRQAELQQLHQAWQKIVDEHDEPSSTGSSATTNAPKPPVQRQGRKKRRLPQVVLIQGPSGAGKSVLVDAFRETTQVRNDGTVTTQFDDAVWTRGKFDPSVSSSREPLLAVLGACVDQMIASLMSRSQTNTSNHWADIIQNDLRSECRVLARLSRRLSSMFDPKEVHTHPHHGCTELGEDDARSTSSHTSRLQEAFGLGGHSRSSRHTRGGFERLKLALRALVRRVTLEFPLVMVWDDLHWMDPASSQLLQYVLQDVEVQGRLLFVGTHRPVDQQADHVFWELSKSLDDAVVTRINLESLTVDACVNILKELVRRDAKDLLPLAQVIHHKTMGNAFSVVQFTRLLYDRKLLQYNMQRYRWEWELDRIQKETQISDSLVDLVIAKLETLPVPVQLILQMAALLGVNRFQVDNLDQGVQLCVFDDLDPEAYTPAAISKYVETAMEEGLLEKIPSNSNSQLAVDCEYMFSHDRIREGAYAMLPEGDTRSLMHLQVGRRLIESVKATDGACAVTGEVFLLAAYHLNIGQALLETQEEMLHAAKINLQASELAFEQSAFFSAANYLEHARAVTRDDWWKLHYQLMLKIATSLAYVKHCCGHNHGSSMMVEDVLLHARNLSDKTPVYRIKILILCQEGRHVQGIHTCIDVLDQHSVKIPRRRLKFRIARSVARTLWRLKKCTEEELDEFEYQNDRKFHDVIQWLQLLGQTAMQVARMEYQVIAALLIVKMVLDKKSLDELQYVAAVGGTAMAFWGDIPKAIFFESVFHKNVNESPPADGAIAGKLLLLFHVTNLHRPYSECTELSFRSLHESIEQCQIAYLFFAMFAYCNLYILSGLEVREPTFSNVHRSPNCLLIPYPHRLHSWHPWKKTRFDLSTCFESSDKPTSWNCFYQRCSTFRIWWEKPSTPVS
jgi:predicted ATPase